MADMMNTWDPSGMSQGANSWQAPSYTYTGGDAGAAGGGSDINQAGAANDPFAYTGGSLLTPWQGSFNSAGYGGGYSAPAFHPFSYADFSYNAPDPGRFTENYQDPAGFKFADYNNLQDFKAPTEEDMKADPGYQARMDAVSKAQTAAAAHGGTLNTGGFQKGLASAVGNQASQEYGNTYNRALQTWNTNYGRGKDIYSTNQGNTKQAFDTNTANNLAGYGARQNAWAGNANIAIQQGQLGNQIAQGTWDRNEQLARQGWQDAANNAQAQASAAAGNANLQYQRALDDYTRSRDEFWTNQDRQTALINGQQQMGLNATAQYGNQLASGYSAMGNQAIGQGNSQAAATNASGSNWGDAVGGIGSTVGAGAYLSGGTRPPVAQPPSIPTTSGFSGLMPGYSLTPYGAPANMPSSFRGGINAGLG